MCYSSNKKKTVLIRLRAVFFLLYKAKQGAVVTPCLPKLRKEENDS